MMALDTRHLVLFENVCSVYYLGGDIVLDITFSSEHKGSSRDWVGIFEVGCESIENPLVYKFGVGRPRSENGLLRKIVFKLKDLKSVKLGVNYQFLYVNKYMEVVGQSKCFKFAIMDSSLRSMSPCSYKSNGSVPNSQKSSSSSSRGTTSISFTRTIPRCNIMRSKAWNNICTSCSECQNVSNFFNLQHEVFGQLSHCIKANEEFEKRLSRLECLLELLYPGSQLIEDLEEERLFLHDSQQSKKVEYYDSLDMGLSSKRELYLKAIIGQQEMQIQRLSNLMQKLETCNKTNMKQDVVLVVKAEEKMLAEPCKVNSSDESTTEV